MTKFYFYSQGVSWRIYSHLQSTFRVSQTHARGLVTRYQFRNPFLPPTRNTMLKQEYAPLRIQGLIEQKNYLELGTLSPTFFFSSCPKIRSETGENA